MPWRKISEFVQQATEVHSLYVVYDIFAYCRAYWSAGLAALKFDVQQFSWIMET